MIFFFSIPIQCTKLVYRGRPPSQEANIKATLNKNNKILFFYLVCNMLVIVLYFASLGYKYAVFTLRFQVSANYTCISEVQSSEYIRTCICMWVCELVCVCVRTVDGAGTCSYSIWKPWQMVISPLFCSFLVDGFSVTSHCQKVFQDSSFDATIAMIIGVRL